MAKTELRGRWSARSVLALGIAATLAVGAWLTPASAAEEDPSSAVARALSGKVLGTNFDDIAEVSGAAAENAGTPGAVAAANPLDFTILETINVEAPGGVGTGVGVSLLGNATSTSTGLLGVHPVSGVEARGAGGGDLPDTGSSSNQLLILGIALIFAGGIAAYAVSRERKVSQR